MNYRSNGGRYSGLPISLAHDFGIGMSVLLCCSLLLTTVGSYRTATAWFLLSCRGQGLWALTGYSPSAREAQAGTQGRTGGRKGGRDYCLWASSLWLAQLALLDNPEPPAQGAGLSHVNHKSRKRHTDIPAGQSDGDDFSLEVALSSQVTLVCDKN